MLLKVGDSSKKKVIILHKSEQEKQKDDEELKFKLSQKLIPYSHVYYDKTIYSQDDEAYKSLSKLKNFELKSLINPNYKEAQQSILKNGYILIDISPNEQQQLSLLAHQVYDFTNHSEFDNQKNIDLEEDYKIVIQLKNLIRNTIGYDIPFSTNASQFELNKQGGDSIHVDSIFNFIFVSTLMRGNQSLPRTNLIPINNNHKFKQNSMTLENGNRLIFGYKIPRNAEDLLEEIPENKAILFLGDEDFTNPNVNRMLKGKHLFHQGHSIDNRDIVSIRFTENKG